jgi:hypothetical protein
MAKITLLICDPSNLRIKHVNIKTDAFRRDLHIRGLGSTIEPMDQKVKFWSTPKFSLSLFSCKEKFWDITWKGMRTAVAQYDGSFYEDYSKISFCPRMHGR